MTARKAVKAYSRGPDHYAWKGGRGVSHGYITVPVSGRHQFEHIVIAERALGKPLPPKAQVHHVNGNRGDNARGNLVVCPDNEYHMLLHRRQRALDACGNPNAHRCRYCRSYDRQWEIRGCQRSDAKGHRYYHLSCNRAAMARYKARRR